ncbi:MAG TPA: cardiolipin synthase [Rubricoccaceae bacterium]|jgi:cardiolipin synthase
MDSVTEALNATHFSLGDAALVAVPLFYLVGVATAVNAVMTSRTPQGSTAWVCALVAFPFVAVPLYWVVGRFTFGDYLAALADFDDGAERRLCEALSEEPFRPAPAEGRGEGEVRAFGALGTIPFTCGNSARLLVDGEETFAAIFAGIDAAEHTVLAQFYTVRGDQIGLDFQACLLRAAARGVQVCLLFDAVGSLGLGRRYLRTLRKGGVEVSSFTGPRNWLKKLRLNFRNHRKIVVVDGCRAFVGGLNVGEEYLGHARIGPWRDTHLAVEGPAVQALQLSFARDWFYACRKEISGLAWTPHAAPEDLTALVLSSGPSDAVETCGLLYTHAIESAETRLWIATPYFIPDGRILGALELAALRGVDVRVLMPRRSDSVLFKFAPYAFLDEITLVGVRVFLYEPGFLHQKVCLVDRDFATVGTANVDNRSFRLNFETTVVVRDQAFCDATAEMLEADFAQATPLSREDLAGKSFAFRFATSATRLLSPVL